MIPAAVTLAAAIVVASVLAYRRRASVSARSAKFELFYEFTNAISESGAASEVLEVMLGEVRRRLDAAVAEVVLLGENASDPVLILTAREGDGLSARFPDEVPGPAWLYDAVVVKRETVVISRSTTDPDRARLLATMGYRDCVVVPLAGRSGPHSLMIVADRTSATFDAQAVRLAALLGDFAGMAIERRGLIGEIRGEVAATQHAELHDALTGLSNRPNLVLQVGALMESAEPRDVALIALGLDRFTDVNDTIGHDNGDLVLREVARRLSSAAPADATVARLGGDTFGVLVPLKPGQPDMTMTIAQRLRNAVEAPVRLHELTLEATVSAGIALGASTGGDAGELLRGAEVAMDWAKRAAPSIETYRPDRDERSAQRLTLAARLRAALDNGELSVDYQPSVALGDGRLLGVSAFVRWPDGDGGARVANDMLEIADRTGLVGPLTIFCVHTALEQASVWRRRGRDLGVTVALSRSSLIDLDLPDKIAHLLRVTDNSASRLTLAVAESSLVDPAGRSIGALRRLADLGVRIAIDEFGTGRTSLAYLRQFPVDELKIAETYVTAMDTDTASADLVGAIIQLARSRDLVVVAKGVSDRYNLGQLERMGCHGAEGPIVGRPMNPAQLEDWLDERRSTPRSVHRAS